MVLLRMAGFTLRRLNTEEYMHLNSIRLYPGQEVYAPPLELKGDIPLQSWGIWQGDTLLGFIEVAGTPPRLWISRIWVDANYQSLGYGRAGLLALIRELRRSARIAELRAAVHPENFPAQRLFERTGFEKLPAADPLGEIIYTLSLR